VQAGVSIAATRKARFRQDALAEASSEEEAVRAQGVNLATACEPDLATRRRPSGHPGRYTRGDALSFQFAGIMTDHANNSWWYLYVLA
jgi:hypothetical protein